MTRNVAKLIAFTIVLASLAGAASAGPVFGPTPVPIQRAPAPLLAAGIPAFIALGGAGFVGRLVRRRKAAVEAKAAGNPDQG